MLLALDVHYDDLAGPALGAALAFEHWEAEAGVDSLRMSFTGVAPYVPGRFFERELKCLVQLTARMRSVHLVHTVVVDGHVDLEADRPGLGRHLHEALRVFGIPVVVGVAKNPFKGRYAQELLRGDSRKPLYVTAAGMEPEAAVSAVASMHGPHRIPTLLKQVDHLARGLE